MTRYTAGWNIPGCLPEVDPETFETVDDAISYLSETVDRFWDEDRDAAHTPGTPEFHRPDSPDDRWSEVFHDLPYQSVPFTLTTPDGHLSFWVTEAEAEA